VKVHINVKDFCYKTSSLAVASVDQACHLYPKTSVKLPVVERKQFLTVTEVTYTLWWCCCMEFCNKC